MVNAVDTLVNECTVMYNIHNQSHSSVVYNASFGYTLYQPRAVFLSNIRGINIY